MKKITFLLFVMAACLCGMQVSAQPGKAPARSDAYSYLPFDDYYESLGTYENPNHIYYSTYQQRAMPTSTLGDVHGVSIIGEIEGKYYSTTYAMTVTNWLGLKTQPDAGAGFIAAMKVGNNSAVLCNAESGTTNNKVRFAPARVVAAGEYAARIIYTLTNNDNSSKTVSLGVWADIMIGDNDSASIYCLRNEQGQVYGLDMKYKNEDPTSPEEKIPVFTALFGEGVTGVTPVDDWWFGQYCNNYTHEEISGGTPYNSRCDIQHGSGSSATWENDVEDVFYKVEGETYDSGMGFCWRNITIPRGESVELSFIVSASEIDFEEPEPDPEEEFHVLVYNTDAWNDLPADHPAHVWGYYKHPMGQTGHMEFMVDGARGTGEWTAIEGELISDAEFDLPFNLNFNPDVADIHTLKLRINDGQGNYRYLDELTQEWEDVRTIPLTVDPETHYYDGTPKTFTVSVGGVFDYPFEYTELGTYDFSIYGDYDMETIGINTIEFSIVKHQPTLDVTIPDDCVYDGEPHAATATYDGDGTVIITYKDSEGNISTEAPVEPGTYEVFVEVTPGVTYDGIENTSYGSFTIDRRPCEYTVVSLPEKQIKKDGEQHGAVVTVPEGSGNLTVIYKNLVTGEESTTPPSEEGRYAIIVIVDDTGVHYKGTEETFGEERVIIWEFEIYLKYPTAVNELNADREDNGAWYTIDGRRVVAPTERGIYIHNGKKYIVK